MKQYFILKQQHPDCMLFYQMGDFYELFFEDAEKGAAILDIALTKRGKQGEADIPLCGVPVHSYETYLEKLIAYGEKVAICAQTETPEAAKKRGGYKAVVNRDVVRVITPGTITEERLLDSRNAHYLAAVGKAQQQMTLGWVDISTGAFHLQPCAPHRIKDEIQRLQPREILIPDTMLDDPLWLEMDISITPQPTSFFDSRKGEQRLKAQYELTVLDSLGELSRADLSASAALLEYLNLTQKGTMPRLDRPRILQSQEHMAIDPATRRNLELTETLAGTRKGSLLHAIDRTITGAGSRLLATRLSSPLTDPVRVNQRLDIVQYFLQQRELRLDIRDALKQCPDVERALSRLYLERGGPRDLQAIVKALDVALQIRTLFTTQQDTGAPASFSHIAEGLNDHAPLREELKSALKEELPLLARDGGFIAKGYHATLDEFRYLRDESKQHIAALQQSYQEETGIPSLKIKFNNVLGYFVEITPTHQAKITDHFIHRQTMKNALRYSSKELAELEHKLRDAADKATKLELELFDQLTAMVKKAGDSLSLTARSLAGLDVANGLSTLAEEQDYCRPAIEDSNLFSVSQARHPVVEQHLQKENTSFIANDCTLQNSDNLWLLTGPNMAGKSTFLRQNALLVILAQSGSFVPAEAATIGMVDRLFSRVGAADDIARGRSTFMVEMVETATILNQATERSLVILDEIGRGTATFDGLSIAWAVVEHLHEKNQCRALFATHYHELTQLTSKLPRLSSHHMKVKEWKGEVIFLHSVDAGAADRSYGIHVAKLAGLPPAVITRADQILKQLEADGKAQNLQQISGDLPLFSQLSEPEATPYSPSAVEEKLETIDPDTLTPREALEIVYELQSLRKSDA